MSKIYMCDGYLILSSLFKMMIQFKIYDNSSKIIRYGDSSWMIILAILVYLKWQFCIFKVTILYFVKVENVDLSYCMLIFIWNLDVTRCIQVLLLSWI